MSESRQQRRSRERSEAKAASQHVLEVELDRIAGDEDDPDYVAWATTWGLREDSVGHEDSSENLSELVEAILRERYELRIEWIVGGDAPNGQTLDDAVAATGITLPSTTTRLSSA